MDFFGYWWLRDWMAQRSNGRLVMDHKGGNEAIPYGNQFAALQAGTVDMVLAPGSFNYATNPFGNLTFLAELNHDGKLPPEVVTYLRDKYASVGVYFLGRVKQWNPYYFFFTKAQPTQLSDFKALKLGAPGGSAHAAMVQGTGAALVVLGTTEMYNALQQSIVDGVAMGADMYTLGLQEKIKYALIPPYKTNDNTSLYMNLNIWRKLPKEYQDIMLSIVDDMQTEGLKRDITAEAGHWNKLKAAGITNFNLAAADVAKFQSLYNDASWQKVQQWNATEYEIMRKLAVIGKGPTGVPY